MKVNAPMSHVCFGAKGDQFGRFWIPVSGSLVAVKLVHVSGTVSCSTNNGDRWSFWGCGGKNIATVITDSSDNIILPQNQQNVFAGYHSNSPQFVFPDLQPPLQVSSGQQLRVWYSEDLSDGQESDNGGLSCADVYAKIA